MKKFVLLVLFTALIATAAIAQTPTVMNYQGRLTDNTPGQTPIDTTVPMDFFIYDGLIGGSLLWNEPWAGGVTVVEGIFSVLLGSNGVPLTSAVFTGGANRYLEIIVGGETLTPRQQIGTVGYADLAASADDLDCVDCLTATDIATGAVGSSEVLDNSIGASDIATGAVGTSEVASNSLTASDLAAGSVGASEIATGAVGASEIAAGAVTATAIGPNAVGNSELDNLSPFEFNGALTINNGGARKFITQNGSVSKLEWWADTLYSYLYHRPALSYLLVNDASGNWGINTTAPTARFDVNGSMRSGGILTAASNVDVAGSVLMGYERVSAAGTTSASAGVCSQGGAWTCYAGSATAVCSAGKVVIGGGCACSGNNDSVCYGYPNSTTSYFCTNVEDSASQPFQAYAICARMGN